MSLTGLLAVPVALPPCLFGTSGATLPTAAPGCRGTRLPGFMGAAAFLPE